MALNVLGTWLYADSQALKWVLYWKKAVVKKIWDIFVIGFFLFFIEFNVSLC